MQGLTWTHIAALGIGVGAATLGAILAPPAGMVALVGLGTTIVGGVLGHAQATKLKPKSKAEG